MVQSSVRTVGEVAQEIEREEEYHKQHMRFEKDAVVLTYGGYPYSIEYGRIAQPKALLDWVAHLTEKDWITPTILGRLIRRVCEKMGWEIEA